MRRARFSQPAILDFWWDLSCGQGCRPKSHLIASKTLIRSHVEPPLIPPVRGLQATIPETVTRSAASSVTGHMIFLRFATKWKRDFPAHFGPEWGSALNERSVGGTSIRPIVMSELFLGVSRGKGLCHVHFSVASDRERLYRD